MDITTDYVNNILTNELMCMMEHVNGQDRCTLCRAIDEIQRKDRPNNRDSWIWLLITMLILFMPSPGQANSMFDQDFMDSFLETLKKKSEGETDEPS